MTGTASCYYTEEWKNVLKWNREISSSAVALAMKRRQETEDCGNKKKKKKGLADPDRQQNQTKNS